MKKLKAFFKNEPLRIILGIALFIPALILELLSYEVASFTLFLLALIVAGAPVFVDSVKGILRRDLLDEKFLMSVASVGAIVIGETTEGVAVMLFFLVGEYFEHRATGKARESIKSLLEICPDTARVLRDGEEVSMDAEDVEVGSLILIRPGERIPIDSVIVEGSAEVDTSAITGEPIPRAIAVGDTVDSGVVLLGSYVIARTLRPMEESRASIVLSLVEEATERKSREENFITSFSRYYTPIVTGLALLMAIIPSVFGWLAPTDAIYRALSFLVVSCPCALVISVPMAFFGGIGAAASEGILFKGGNVFSAVASLRNIVFDKTGTLTRGELTASGIYPIGIDKEDFLSLVASAEHNSNHPIALCLKQLSPSSLPADSFAEVTGMGIVARVGDRDVAVGNLRLMESLSLSPDEVSGAVVFVAIDGAYSGYITLTDKVKDEAFDSIRRLEKLGVSGTMIFSGDHADSVESVKEALSIEKGYGDLLPEDKYARLEALMENSNGKTAFVGDGINDAPCLARADVGIAMGERGTDSAIEAADLVIMSDNLSRIPQAIEISRRTISIAKQNIVFAIGIKLLVLVLASLNLAGMWLAVFADVGVAVLAILNSMRTLIRPKKK